MTIPIDAIGQEVNVGDVVFCYNNLYEVMATGKAGYQGHGPVRIILVRRSKTTRPVTKHSNDMVVVDKEQVYAFLNK